MMKSLLLNIILLSLLALPAYALDGPRIFPRPHTPIYETEDYQVFKEAVDGKRSMRVVHVVLMYRASEEMTRQFAEEIIAQGDSTISWTNILFYYPHYGPTDTYYANARTGDSLDFRFHGPDQSEFDSLKSDEFLPPGTVSSWISDISARRYDLVYHDGEWAIHLHRVADTSKVWQVVQEETNSYRWTNDNGIKSILFHVSDDQQTLEIDGYWSGFSWDIAESFR